jgi:hypothetical protein
MGTVFAGQVEMRGGACPSGPFPSGGFFGFAFGRFLSWARQWHQSSRRVERGTLRASFRADRPGDLGPSRKKYQNLESGRGLAQGGGMVGLGSEFPRHL